MLEEQTVKSNVLLNTGKMGWYFHKEKANESH